MKWYYRNVSVSDKSKLTANNGPFHRSYRLRPGKQASQLDAKELSLVTTPIIKNQEGRLRQLFHKNRHQFDRRQPQAGSLQQKMPTEACSDLITESSKMRTSIRVAWVHQALAHLPKALSLRTRFADAGMEVNVLQWAIDDVVPLDCELIVLDCCTLLEQEMMKFLLKIRFFTQAPLIILMDNHTLDGTVLALRGGADAIFTVNIPDDVIMARSNALLRRWLPS